MAKTEEELQALKVKVEEVCKKLNELSDEELDLVFGGNSIGNVGSVVFAQRYHTTVAKRTPSADTGTNSTDGRPNAPWC